nr:P3 [Caladenia virus A]
GTFDQIKRMLKSREDLLAVLQERPAWLVNVFLSPTQIWALAVSAERYRVVDTLLKEQPDLAMAIKSIIVVGRGWSMYKRLKPVIDSYYKEIPKLTHAMKMVLGDHYEDFQLAFSQFLIARQPVSIEHLFDQFYEKKSTIEELEEHWRALMQVLLVEQDSHSRSFVGKYKRTLDVLQARMEEKQSYFSASLGNFFNKVKSSWTRQMPKNSIDLTTTMATYPQRVFGLVSGKMAYYTGRSIIGLTVHAVKYNVSRILRDAAVYAISVSIVLSIISCMRMLLRRVEKLIKTTFTGESVVVYQ